VYKIANLPSTGNRNDILLQIKYRGDVARLYCNGKLVADNFYNGRPMLYGLWRLPAEADELELRILPLQENMPVYFPEEADTTPGEEVINVSIIPAN
ncbi:MAG: beta-galactosidase, partial [Muribaculaceae bacterium]|nr:beta-galactosidase [Muribaculaceae bacterium]